MRRLCRQMSYSFLSVLVDVMWSAWRSKRDMIWAFSLQSSDTFTQVNGLIAEQCVCVRCRRDHVWVIFMLRAQSAQFTRTNIHSVKPSHTLNASPFSLFMKPFILLIMGLMLAQTDFCTKIQQLPHYSSFHLMACSPHFPEPLSTQTCWAASSVAGSMRQHPSLGIVNNNCDFLTPGIQHVRSQRCCCSPVITVNWTYLVLQTFEVKLSVGRVMSEQVCSDSRDVTQRWLISALQVYSTDPCLCPGALELWFIAPWTDWEHPGAAQSFRVTSPQQQFSVWLAVWELRALFTHKTKQWKMWCFTLLQISEMSFR